MNIVITDVTPLNATVNGQVVTLQYAQDILLPLCVAAKGDSDNAVIKVAKIFSEAGLSLAGSPTASRLYSQHLVQQKELLERRQAEARAHAQRMYEPTRAEIAKAQREREEWAAEIRAQGERIRAANGR